MLQLQRKKWLVLTCTGIKTPDERKIRWFVSKISFWLNFLMHTICRFIDRALILVTWYLVFNHIRSYYHIRSTVNLRNEIAPNSFDANRHRASHYACKYFKRYLSADKQYYNKYNIVTFFSRRENEGKSSESLTSLTLFYGSNINGVLYLSLCFFFTALFLLLPLILPAQFKQKGDYCAQNLCVFDGFTFYQIFGWQAHRWLSSVDLIEWNDMDYTQITTYTGSKCCGIAMQQ